MLVARITAVAIGQGCVHMPSAVEAVTGSILRRANRGA
jgi:hypothetical protein